MSFLRSVLSRQLLDQGKNTEEKTVMLSCVCFSGSWVQRWASAEWSWQTWSWSCCVWGETATRKPLNSIIWRRRSRRPKACWIRRANWVCSSNDQQQIMGIDFYAWVGYAGKVIGHCCTVHIFGLQELSTEPQQTPEGLQTSFWEMLTKVCWFEPPRGHL